MKIKIHSIKKGTASELYVEGHIMDGKNFIETRRFSFPLDSSEEHIKQALKKCLDLYVLRTESNKKNKDKYALDKKATETVEKLSGKEIQL